jgi:hypothetical protein
MAIKPANMITRKPLLYLWVDLKRTISQWKYPGRAEGFDYWCGWKIGAVQLAIWG